MASGTGREALGARRRGLGTWDWELRDAVGPNFRVRVKLRRTAEALAEAVSSAIFGAAARRDPLVARRTRPRFGRLSAP